MRNSRVMRGQGQKQKREGDREEPWRGREPQAQRTRQGGEAGKGREGETERRGPQAREQRWGEERGRFRTRGWMCQSQVHRERVVGNRAWETPRKMCE